MSTTPEVKGQGLKASTPGNTEAPSFHADVSAIAHVGKFRDFRSRGEPGALLLRVVHIFKSRLNLELAQEFLPGWLKCKKLWAFCRRKERAMNLTVCREEEQKRPDEHGETASRVQRPQRESPSNRWCQSPRFPLSVSRLQTSGQGR